MKPPHVDARHDDLLERDGTYIILLVFLRVLLLPWPLANPRFVSDAIRQASIVIVHC